MSEPDAAPEQANALVGRVLSERYRIERLLGEGGMGAVYQAEHLLMRKRVAIKVLHAEMSRMSEVVARFEREAMAAAHIEHPNVAAATDFGKLEDGSFFLVLEFVEGKALRDVLDEAPLDPKRAVHIARQVLTALARAHAMGIVHRDLKPENVMLVQRDGDPDFVKVLDFGIAKVPMGQQQASGGPALTQQGMVYGTPEYMAPEQALAQDVDARADLYALGVMLFEMLTAKRPFDSPNKVQILGMVISMPVPSFEEVVPGHTIPPALEQVTRTLLAKVADERYADAKATLAALDVASPPDAPYGPVSAAIPSAIASGRSPIPSKVDVVGNTIVAANAGATAPAGGSKKPTPPLVLAISAGAGLIGLVLIVVVLALHGNKEVPAAGIAPSADASGDASAPTSATPPPAGKTASDDELTTASTGGLAALTALRAKYPADPRVGVALARADIAQKNWADANKVLAQVAGQSPDALHDNALHNLILPAAMSDTREAFDLLETSMADVGPDILYEVLTAPGSSKAKPSTKHADASLSKPAVREKASPALKLALDLRGTGGLSGSAACEGKKHLLPRAKEVGDARALAYLAPLTNQKGCGSWWRKTDCFPCLRGDSALSDAISAIKSREKNAKD